MEYDWSQPVSTKQIEVYWWDDHQGVRLPKACHVKFWGGNSFIEITNATGLGVEGERHRSELHLADRMVPIAPSRGSGQPDQKSSFDVFEYALE